MGLGGLATIAVAKPRNLVIIVIDNGHFGETGMQKSHTGRGIEIADVAQACGIEARIARHLAEVEAIRKSLRRLARGPRLYVVKVKPENLPRSLPPRDAGPLSQSSRPAGQLSLEFAAHMCRLAKSRLETPELMFST
jgi:thiamine pyrophosphate-dependent acetolactate synthase large subunit-like protein